MPGVHAVAMEQHIASLVVMHRAEAEPALVALVADRPALAIAARGEHRMVLLCETQGQRALMEHIDALEQLAGVINVLLIYHHAESAAELDEPIGHLPAHGGNHA